MDNSKQESKRYDSVIVGSTKVKKKSGLQKFADAFLPEDLEAVKRRIVREVVVRGFQKGVLSIMEALFDMNGSSGSNGSRSSVASNVSYRDYYDRERRDYRGGTYALYDFDEIVYNSYGDAEMVLSQMDDILDRFKVVRVSDMYDLSKLDWPAVATDYGWTNLSTAKVIQVRDGYAIRLPKAMPLDR